MPLVRALHYLLEAYIFLNATFSGSIISADIPIVEGLQGHVVFKRNMQNPYSFLNPFVVCILCIMFPK